MSFLCSCVATLLAGQCGSDDLPGCNARMFRAGKLLMLDILMLGLGAVLFAAAILYARLAEEI